ncbi:MAG: CaiB/BaiF CoA transferase family protein [Acidimicrobiia bacterium]
MGPLEGVKIVEMAAIGPVPFCGMLLGDLGADVVRVDRTVPATGRLPDMLQRIVGRSRRSIAVDLKTDAGREVALRLADEADVLLEGFRPGVMERLGLGPATCHERNPRLVYGRMTGWGQDGPLAPRAGHDINYIGLAGPLGAIGTAEAPLPPLNLIGDYGGGAMYLAFGVVTALVERERSGEGQIVDAAMVDGAASLMTPIYQLFGHGGWSAERASNMLDGGAPFYRTYQTKDGQFMAVGSLEPQFYAELLSGLGLQDAGLPAQGDRQRWPELHARFGEVFATKTRDEWEAVFSGTDACVTPVLTMGEAPAHAQSAARSGFVAVDGIIQPAPAPRFDRTPSAVPGPAPGPGADTDEVLAELGYDAAHRAVLRDGGAVS